MTNDFSTSGLLLATDRRSEPTDLGEFVNGDRGQLTIIAGEYDRIGPDLVVHIAAVVQTVPPSLGADDRADDSSRPSFLADFYLVLNLDAIASHKLGDQMPHLRFSLGHCLQVASS